MTGDPEPAAGIGAAEDLRGDIEAFGPRTDREAGSRERMLAELSRLTRPFDREADPVHFTASAIVIGSRGVLLHLHKRIRRWLQPGGHIDPGETPVQAALREASEETGLEVALAGGRRELFHLDVHTAYAGHIHLDLRYLLEAPDRDPAPVEGESQEVAWFTREAAEELADEALLDALRRLPEPPRSRT
jgi:8-oxo-dGTP pyrophosphatase MutT (NUDIX family)